MARRRDHHTLDDHPLFVGERRRARQLYARHAERLRLPAGTVLVAEGRQPAQVTWIRSGRAQVSRWGAPLGEVGPGAAVGAPELASLAISDVTVIATTALDAVVLHRRAFRGAWRALPGVRRASGSPVRVA
jgi:CRP-like cAMP-binding protein